VLLQWQDEREGVFRHEFLLFLKSKLAFSTGTHSGVTRSHSHLISYNVLDFLDTCSLAQAFAGGVW
jgi:uncharacterized membrane protein YqgA involved in biofilm formation